jgi:hypothetical protein
MPIHVQVAKACAYGDFDKLKQMVDADVSCVNLPDEQGYLPLQVNNEDCGASIPTSWASGVLCTRDWHTAPRAARATPCASGS